MLKRAATGRKVLASFMNASSSRHTRGFPSSEAAAGLLNTLYLVSIVACIENRLAMHSATEQRIWDEGRHRMEAYKTLLVDRRGKIVIITLHRPGDANCLNGQMAA